MRQLSAGLLLLCLATVAPGQDRPRFDIVRFDPPDGWTRREADGKLVLESADKGVRIEVSRSTPLSGTIDATAAALREAASKQAGYHSESEPIGDRHASSKGQWRYFAYSRSNPDAAGCFLYQGVIVIAAGDRCSTFELVADTAPGFDANRAAFSKLANKVQLTSGIRLERGTPPLTRYMLDEATAFLEWLVQSPLNEDQKATVEAEVRGFWKQKVQSEIDGVVELLAARTLLAALPEAERDLARVAAAEQAVEQWRKEKDNASARMMLAIHDAAHAPIARGEPPLTRQAVEAYAEFLNFAAGKTVDVDDKLPKETRDRLVAAVAEAYAEMTPEQRETIAGMPMIWAAMRVMWPQFDEARRQQYVQGWKQDPSIAALGKSLSDQSALAKMRDLQSRQLQMQAQQAYWNTMSNIMRSQSNTAHIISSNFGGNTRYEYRW